MSKDEVPLGKVIEVDDAQRDAVHIAVFPAIAGERLRPGEHVVIASADGGITVESADKEKAIGIVDPFLLQNVKRGQKIYVCLFPNTITGMSHHWRHPAFDNLPTPEQVKELTAKSQAQEWLTDYARGIGCRFEELMDAAERYVRHGEYWCQGDRFDGVYLGDEFWPYYEAYTGETVPKDQKYSFFSCSC